MPDQLPTPPLDWRLGELARRQHGVVSHGQLVELGLGKSAIGDWAKRGRLHRVHRGVYALRYPTLTRNGQFMAAVLACGEKAALSHFSAAVLWGMLKDGGGVIHVTAESRRRRPGLVVHEAALCDREVARRAGIAVTAPARTLIDLADVAPRRTLERAIDEAEYLRLDCTGLAPRRGRRGAGALSSVLAVHRPGSTRTRSHLEELFIVLCVKHGLPRPEVNVHVEGYECDFVWREQRLIVETDGGAAHGTRRAKRRDPVRDARLMIAGWRVWRLSYEQLVREPDTVAEQLRGLGITPARPPAAPGARRRSSRRPAARPRRPRP
jgi:REase_MTES_1575/Transcriptional regulator, AbiEi antitoxin